MTITIQLFVLGMATGGFYTINALGVVVVFRSSGIINFASGGVAMVGGYLEWKFADGLGWPHYLAVAAAVGVSAVLGAAIHALVIRPLAAASTLAKVIATLGVLVSLEQVITLTFGGVPRLPSSYLPTSSVHFASVSVGLDSLILLGFAVVLTGAMWALYRFTPFGLATSALAENPQALAALGWRVGRLRTANWAIGGGLAGLAGAGLGPILQLNGTNFAALIVPTLASAVIGGLESFPLTLLGGLVLGAMQAEANRITVLTNAGQALPFLVIIAVLVWRGRNLPVRSFVQERLPRVGSGEIPIVRVVGGLVLVGALGLVVNEDWVIGATLSVITAMVLLSQVVITGYAGQLSLAQLTMGGVGAVVAANAAASWHVSFLVALALGVLAAVPVSLLVGLPSLRARGVSLAIATLGFGVALNAVVLNNSKFTGGLAGLTLAPQSLFGISIDATLYPRRFFLVALGLFVLLAVAVANLRRGRTGRRMLAVRSNERAAEALGIATVVTKLYAFALAGMISAVAGVLLVLRQSLPQFSSFDPLAGLSTLVTGVLGGIGFLFGSVIGGLLNADGLPNAVLNPLVGQWTWWTNAVPLATGVILVIQLALNPDGIAAAVSRGRTRAREQPRDRGTAVTALLRVRPSALRATRAEQRRRLHIEQLKDAATLPRSQRQLGLDVRDVRVRFGTVTAVDGVSFTVQPGEVLGVIGPNGAGKTTLMDAVTGFVPMSGAVELADRRIDGWSVHRRARAGISRSFQSLELLEDMTVLDNLRCAADPQDARSMLFDLVAPGRGVLTPAIAAAVTAFGMADKLELLPTELSYGDRRLLGIARAVAGGPSVLFLDEPAAGLSELERGEVSALITMMAHEWGIAILLIEHDVAMVRRVADRVIALDFGRPIATGTADEVLAHPAVMRAYLGTDEDPAPDTTAPTASTAPSTPSTAPSTSPSTGALASVDALTDRPTTELPGSTTLRTEDLMTMLSTSLPRAACITLGAGLLALTACSSSGGGGASHGASTINVLVDTSLTASAAQGGVSFPWPAIGVKAAAKAMNAAGGINGHKIVVTVCDNKSDPNVSAQCGRTAASKKAVAVVGSFDGFGASQLLPVLKAAGIPYIGGLPTSPAEFTNPVSFQFDPGAVLGGFALSKLMVDSGCKKAVILAPGIPSEPATLAGQKAFLHKQNVQISSVDVPTTATDVNPVVSQALAKKPDCLSFSGQGQLTAQIIVASRKLGYKGKFVTSIGSLLPQFLRPLGAAANGVIVNSSTLLPTASDPMVTAFRKDMTSFVGTGPALQMDMNEFAQDGWSSMQLLKQALAGASTVSAGTVLKKLPTLCDVNVGNVYPHVNLCKQNPSKLFPRTYNDQYRYFVAKNGQYVEVDARWHDASETVGK